MSEPLAIAAQRMGVTQRTLERWIADGAPVVRRGSRGRGNCTLVDINAVTAWRRGASGQDALQAIANEIPEILADAMYEALQLTEGPHKRTVAGALAGAWYLGTTAVLDRCREEAGNVQEVSDVPEKISKLRRIFGASGTVDSTHSRGP